MNCLNCNTTLNEGEKFCPTCGTPAGAVPLKSEAPTQAAAPIMAVAPVMAVAPKKSAGGKVLAAVAYTLYAIAAVLLVAVLVLVGNATSSGGKKHPNKVSGGTTITITKPGGNQITVKPSNPSGNTSSKVEYSFAPPYTDISDRNPEAFEEYMNHYVSYVYFDICPCGGGEVVDPDRAAAIMKKAGFDSETIAMGVYTVCKIDGCSTIAQVEAHCEAWFTENILNDNGSDLYEDSTGVYYFVGAMGYPGYSLVQNSMIIPKESINSSQTFWTALFVEDYTNDIYKVKFLRSSDGYRVDDIELTDLENFAIKSEKYGNILTEQDIEYAKMDGDGQRVALCLTDEGMQKWGHYCDGNANDDNYYIYLDGVKLYSGKPYYLAGDGWPRFLPYGTLKIGAEGICRRINDLVGYYY